MSEELAALKGSLFASTPTSNILLLAIDITTFIISFYNLVMSITTLKTTTAKNLKLSIYLLVCGNTVWLLWIIIQLYSDSLSDNTTLTYYIVNSVLWNTFNTIAIIFYSLLALERFSVIKTVWNYSIKWDYLLMVLILVLNFIPLMWGYIERYCHKGTELKFTNIPQFCFESTYVKKRLEISVYLWAVQALVLPILETILGLPLILLTCRVVPNRPLKFMTCWLLVTWVAGILNAGANLSVLPNWLPDTIGMRNLQNIIWQFSMLLISIEISMYLTFLKTIGVLVRLQGHSENECWDEKSFDLTLKKNSLIVP